MKNQHWNMPRNRVATARRDAGIPQVTAWHQLGLTSIDLLVEYEKGTEDIPEEVYKKMSRLYKHSVIWLKGEI